MRSRYETASFPGDVPVRPHQPSLGDTPEDALWSDWGRAERRRSPRLVAIGDESFRVTIRWLRASIIRGLTMTCKDFIEFLHEYLSGELAPAQQVRFEEHLSICESCVAYLSNYEDTMKLAKLALCDPEGPLPGEVPEELVAAILAARREEGDGPG
jgi:hypothetical protein